MRLKSAPLALCLWVFTLVPSQADELDPVAAIDSWNATLSPIDRQAKYCKMVESPFLFYRGSNHLFWQEFAGDGRLADFASEQTAIWLQGDLHTDNYGSYDDATGTLVYTLNDFDEGVIADYQYDLWRMAVSLVLVAREAANLSDEKMGKVLDAFSMSYLQTLAEVRGNDDELRLHTTIANAYGRLDEFLQEVSEDDSRKRMLKKWTHKQDGERRFDLDSDKLGGLSAMQQQRLHDAMPAYGGTLSGPIGYDAEWFRVKDAAARLNAGTGSLGTPRYYLLIEGESDSQADDRILDVKRQDKPTPYHFLGDTFQQAFDTHFPNPGERHALAMRALTLHTDPYLGWMVLDDGVYSVRERSPWKEALPTAELTSAKRLRKLAEQWGTILALAHARSDRDFAPSLIDYAFENQVVEQVAGDSAGFSRRVNEVAFAYANRVAQEWAQFRAQVGADCPH